MGNSGNLDIEGRADRLTLKDHGGSPFSLSRLQWKRALIQSFDLVGSELKTEKKSTTTTA
jgi:hypothetical protein